MNTTQPPSHEEVQQHLRDLPNKISEDLIEWIRKSGAMLESLLADNVRLNGEVDRLNQDIDDTMLERDQLRARKERDKQIIADQAADNLRLSKRIAALEKALTFGYDGSYSASVADENNEGDGVPVTLYYTSEQAAFKAHEALCEFIDTAINPAGQCSGTAK